MPYLDIISACAYNVYQPLYLEPGDEASRTRRHPDPACDGKMRVGKGSAIGMLAEYTVTIGCGLLCKQLLCQQPHKLLLFLYRKSTTSRL